MDNTFTPGIEVRDRAYTKSLKEHGLILEVRFKYQYDPSFNTDPSVARQLILEQIVASAEHVVAPEIAEYVQHKNKQVEGDVQ